MYLYERLADRFPCEIVPGVSSMMASAAALRRPLAARNDVLSVIPGPLPDAEIEARLDSADAVAIIKIGRHFNRIVSLLEKLNLVSCAGYLERVSLPEERILPLSEAGDHAGVRPGLVVFRSFGKFFGLAGMRLGFVLAEAAFLDRVDRRQGPWATSGPALEVARLLLSDADAIRAVTERIAERGRALKRTLEGAALSIAGGTDLFVLVDDARAPVIHTALCQKHILTRTFRYQPNWIRFGLCPDSESDQRLGRALASMAVIRPTSVARDFTRSARWAVSSPELLSNATVRSLS